MPTVPAVDEPSIRMHDDLGGGAWRGDAEWERRDGLLLGERPALRVPRKRTDRVRQLGDDVRVTARRVQCEMPWARARLEAHERRLVRGDRPRARVVAVEGKTGGAPGAPGGEGNRG